MSKRSFCSAALAGLMLLVAPCATAHGQLDPKRPTLKKNPKVIPLPNLVIDDIFYGDNLNSVQVSVGNYGTAHAGRFVVRLSIRNPRGGATTYAEKTVWGLDVNKGLPVVFKLKTEAKGLEFGVFVDAKREVAESNETNCGKLYPSGGAAGYLPCEGC